MHVRRNPNKAGSVSVQVIDKNKSRYRVIKSFGTGNTEVEIVRLENHARQYVREVTGMNRKLFEDEDEVKLINFISSITNSQIRVIGPELIFGTLYYRVGYSLYNIEVLSLKLIQRSYG